MHSTWVGRVGPDQDVGVQEVGGDDVRAEGRVSLLEHHRHDVVADVSFALQLLAVRLGEGQQGGHMEHHLLAEVLCVEAVLTGLTELRVQAAPVAGVLRQHHLAPHTLQEPLHGRTADEKRSKGNYKQKKFIFVFAYL